MRHGIVAFDASASVTSREWPDLLDRFNASALTPESLPSQSLCQLVQSTAVIVTSVLPRAIASAHALAPVRTVRHMEDSVRHNPRVAQTSSVFLRRVRPLRTNFTLSAS